MHLLLRRPQTLAQPFSLPAWTHILSDASQACNHFSLHAVSSKNWFYSVEFFSLLLLEIFVFVTRYWNNTENTTDFTHFGESR